MWQAETDKRKCLRAEVHCRVSCGRMSGGAGSDQEVSQTKDISEGGMAFTAGRQFSPQTNLALNVSLPVTQKPVHITGTVIESKKTNPHYAYFTRISFCEMDEQKRRAIQQTVAYYSRKNRLRY